MPKYEGGPKNIDAKPQGNENEEKELEELKESWKTEKISGEEYYRDFYAWCSRCFDDEEAYKRFFSKLSFLEEAEKVMIEKLNAELNSAENDFEKIAEIIKRFQRKFSHSKEALKKIDSVISKILNDELDRLEKSECSDEEKERIWKEKSGLLCGLFKEKEIDDEIY